MPMTEDDQLKALVEMYAAEAEKLNITAEVNGPTARGNYWVNLEIPIPQEVDIPAILGPLLTPQLKAHIASPEGANIGSVDDVDDEWLVLQVEEYPDGRSLPLGISMAHAGACTPAEAAADIQAEVAALTRDWTSTVRDRFCEELERRWSIDVEDFQEPSPPQVRRAREKHKRSWGN